VISSQVTDTSILAVLPTDTNRNISI